MNDQKNICTCFGKFSKKTSRCASCVWLESCRYCTETEKMMNSRSHFASFERMQEWHDDIADYDHIPGESSEDDVPEDLIPLLGRFFRFLLDLDDYSIGVICEVISPANSEKRECTVTSLSKLHGCSRQAMHRKILDMIARYPDLSVLLQSTMRKLSGGRQRFLRRNSAAKGGCAAV